MRVMQYIFWICAGTILYTYAVYPIVLAGVYMLTQLVRDLRYVVTRRERRVRGFAESQEPSVTMIMPAYNEEARLRAKLANLPQIDYPKSKLKVIIVSDGSTDGTNDILRELRDPAIETIFLPVRAGKPNALNEAVSHADSEVLIFSDAATLFAPDAVRKLVRHFADPTVGVVCGALEFENTQESLQTEALYWKFESMLRLMEGRLGATLTASGACYAVRRQCSPTLAADTVIDDFVVPMHARKLGYRVVYDPEATAREVVAESVDGEFVRRVRLGAGSFRALGMLAAVPLKGFSSFAFFSHKVLRWVVPFLLIGLLVSNAALWNRWPYGYLLVPHLAFYLWAVLGFVVRNHGWRIRYLQTGYFLLAMNIAFLIGFIRFLRGRQNVTWERVN